MEDEKKEEQEQVSCNCSGCPSAQFCPGAALKEEIAKKAEEEEKE